MKNAVYQQKLLMKKVEAPSFTNLDKITSSRDCVYAAAMLWDLDQINIVEHFYVLYINRVNKIIAYAEIGRGGIDAVLVDKRIIFAHALLAAATGLILFHNHPSGNMKPSQADINLTRDIKKAGEAIGIAVFDHIIMSPNLTDFYSFADEGMI
jgi:DNA repair protein RadC